MDSKGFRLLREGKIDDPLLLTCRGPETADKSPIKAVPAGTPSLSHESQRHNTRRKVNDSFLLQNHVLRTLSRFLAGVKSSREPLLLFGTSH